MRTAEVQAEEFDNPKDDSTIHTCWLETRDLWHPCWGKSTADRSCSDHYGGPAREVADGVRNHLRHLSKFGLVILIKMATTTIAPNSTYQEAYLSTEDTVSLSCFLALVCLQRKPHSLLFVSCRTVSK